MLGIKELIKKYAETHGVSLAEAEKAVKNTIDTITDAIVEDGGISIIGKFSIETVQKKERIGRNPATGEPHTIPASKGIKIKCGKLLKERLNP